MGNAILIILVLAAHIFISSVIFWILLNKKIKLWKAVKLVCTATSLNRLFLTGSGYAAMSYKLKRDDLSFYKSVPAFIMLELFSISPCLILGVYFGSKIAIKLPFLLIMLLAVILILAMYKKRKAGDFIKEVWAYFKGIRFNIPIIIPLVLISLILWVIYYFLLLKIFGFVLPVIDSLKIATVSVTIGYLSPAPAGLGFKEGGLIFLLMQKGLSFKDSLAVALLDRAILTGFYLGLGFLFGAEMIVSGIKKRFSRDFPVA